MSLSELLAGELPAGVYRWRRDYAPGIEDELRAAAVEAGWAFAPVWGTATKDEALEGIGAALGFGEHYGRINAENLKRAHALIESGKAKGKIVLEGF